MMKIAGIGIKEMAGTAAVSGSGRDWFFSGICGLGLHFRLDGFRLIYLCIAVLMWTVSGSFSLEYMAHYKKKGRYYAFFWATFAATVGVFLSADLYTTFIFFEIMSFTSYVWVAFDEGKESLRAAETYLAVAVIGGLVMLMGLFLLYADFGTLEMDALGPLAKEVLAAGTREERMRLYAAGGLLLFGFGAKAGCFPLHIWLPKAHPVAPAPASALLSGILTKAGVFGVIFVSCILFDGDGGWGLLISLLGLITMFLGALLALFSTNLKRTLACSSVSQIGFILTGIGVSVLLSRAGEENLLAVHGAFLHMVNHSLIKLVLFLCAGAIYMNLHQLELNEIRGFGRKKPALLFCFLMGALGIGGMPLWNGYVSKTLIHEGIVEYIEAVRTVGPMVQGGGDVWNAGIGAILVSPAFWKGAEWLFLISGGMTVAYMLKLFVVLFVDRHPERQEEYDAMSVSYMRPLSRFVLAGSAAILPVLGMTPHRTMEYLAALGEGFFRAGGETMRETVHPAAYFSSESLKGGLISIAIGLLLYVFLVRGWMVQRKEDGNLYINRWPAWLDLENFIYRPVLKTLLPAVLGAVCGVLDRYLVPVFVSLCMAVSSVGCRAMDHMADGVIVLARKTTHSQLPEPKAHKEGNWLAHFFGHLIDGAAFLWDKLTGRMDRYLQRPSAVPGLLKTELQIKHIGRLVEESFSFGLMLFCIGLCMTLGYLLWVFLR